MQKAAFTALLVGLGGVIALAACSAAPGGDGTVSAKVYDTASNSLGTMSGTCSNCVETQCGQGASGPPGPACVCVAGDNLCGSSPEYYCANLNNDPNNCGGCGDVCEGYAGYSNAGLCVSGKCVAPPAPPSGTSVSELTVACTELGTKWECTWLEAAIGAKAGTFMGQYTTTPASVNYTCGEPGTACAPPNIAGENNCCSWITIYAGVCAVYYNYGAPFTSDPIDIKNGLGDGCILDPCCQK